MIGNEFLLSNPNNGFDQSNQSGVSYSNEPIYLVPSVQRGRSTGDETSQSSNQQTSDHRETKGDTNFDKIGSTGDFPFGISHDVTDEASPDGNERIDQSESSIINGYTKKNLTEMELSDPTWNIFRLSKMEQKLRSGFKLNFDWSIEFGLSFFEPLKVKMKMIWICTWIVFYV